jgi:hypothetical protein
MSNTRSNTRRNPSNAVLFTRLSLIFEKGSLDQLKSFLKNNEINRLKNDDIIHAITYSKNNPKFQKVDNKVLANVLWSQRAVKSRSRKTRKVRKNKMLK